MRDALACNFVAEIKTIIGKCLSHGRRMFVNVVEHFPQQCRHVIEGLVHHQSHSDPPMQDLQRGMNEQLEQRLGEPNRNSGLGGALRYMLAHWSGLTLLLRQAGAPLDNNICERALKRAIRHPKNSMFYKTLKGAQVGDIYMSLISTCELCAVNPFSYPQALQRHVHEVMATPALWLPWNYPRRRAKACRYAARRNSPKPARLGPALDASHDQQLQLARLQHARRLPSVRPEGELATASPR